MSRVLMVASEAAPFVQTGGLGDVLSALPAALAARGEEVAVVLPRYRAARIPSAERAASDIRLSLGPHHLAIAVDQAVYQGVRYLFVDSPPLYDRAGIYGDDSSGYADNHIRYGFLNQAAIAIARYVFRPSVFHAHDWQGGLLAPLLRTQLSLDPTFLAAKCVLTIHNLGYQGNFPAAALADLGLGRTVFHPAGMEFFGQASFLKAGIVWSDAVNTVSPTYAREIQTPEYGSGFDGLLRSSAHKVSGILNGADYAEWNPERDRRLASSYSAANLAGKRRCKKALLEEMRLPDDGTAPLIGVVSRLAGQKGFDLLEEIAPDLAREKIAMAVLGSGEARFEAMFRSLAREYPGKFAVRIGYDNALAHRIEAGADMFLMPSRYEPCGLNQMYSLRYGTVPIVRATGGLEDTVDEETGFKFREFAPAALAEAIGSALEAWEDQDAWIVRMRKGMARDFSWDASAAAYQRLYAG